MAVMSGYKLMRLGVVSRGGARTGHAGVSSLGVQAAENEKTLPGKARQGFRTRRTRRRKLA